MTTIITPTGWLVAGTQRVRLDTVERYEQREGKVLLSGTHWSLAIDCMPPEEPQGVQAKSAAPAEKATADADWQARKATATADAVALIAALDTHFTPPAP